MGEEEEEEGELGIFDAAKEAPPFFYLKYPWKRENPRMLAI